MGRIVKILFVFLFALTACGGSHSAGTNSGGGTGASEPLMVVAMAKSSIPTGGGPYSFGRLVVGNASEVEFDIRNNGTANLTIGDISITGPNHPEYFTAVSYSASTILPGASATFKISFKPLTAGTFSDVLVSIPNNDTTVNDNFLFYVSGVGTTTTPQMCLADSTNQTILSISGTKDFGYVISGASATETFTVKNTGTADLTLSSVTSSAPSVFSILSFTSTALAPDAAGTIVIRFAPTSTGYATSIITIASNDPLSPFTFTAAGTATAAAKPSISVKQGATNLAAGTGTYTFVNTILTASTSTTTFNIQNLGNADLTVASISSSIPGIFIPGSSPGTISAGGSGSFTVQFKPTATGAQSATLTIASDDPLTPSYVISLNGTGINPAAVFDESSYDFGSVLTGNVVSKTLTIRNTGTSNMVIAAGSISPSPTGEFTITAQPAAGTLASGSSTSFTVQYAPTTSGLKTPSFTFSYANDAAAPYSLPITTIRGTGFSPSLSVTSGDGLFGSVLYNTTSAERTITIKNNGTGDAIISSTAVVGTEPYVITASPSSTIAAGVSSTIKLVYKPTATGASSDTLRIISNDAASPLDIPLSGTGTAPSLSVTSGDGLFGSVLYNTTSAERTITIKNNGNGDAIISSTAVVGTEPYVITASPSSTIAAGVSSTIKLAYKPTATGASSDTLRITYNNATPLDIALSGTGTAPSLSVTSGDGLFGSVLYNTTSAERTITIKNNGTGDAIISSTAVVGTEPYVITASPSSTIAAGVSSTIKLAYKPTATGASSDTLRITYNNATPLDIPLSGTGTAPSLSVTSGDGLFGSVLYNTTSAERTITIKNNGNGDAIISSTAVVGTEPYVITASPSSTIAAGVSSTIKLVYKPTAAGASSDTLRIISNDAASPLDIALSGTGTAPSLSVTSGDGLFGNVLYNTTSAERTITIKNNGNGDAIISSTAVVGTEPYVITASPSSTIAAGVSSTIKLAYKPTATGASSDTLRITYNNATPLDIPLSGTGTAPSLSVTSGDGLFGSVLYNTTSAERTITIKNNGNGDAIISSTAVVGTEPYVITASPSSTIAAGVSSTIKLVYKPTAAGASSDTLRITYNTATPLDIPLSGTGTAPSLSVTSGDGLFGSVLYNTTSAERTITIKNNGNGDAIISSTAVVGTEPYVITASPSSTIAAGVSSTIKLVYKPTAAGASSDTLRIISNDAASPLDIALSGTGTAPSLSVTSGDGLFGNVLYNTTSAERTITIKNNGNGDAIISSTAVVGTEPYVITASPSSTIAAGVSSTIKLVYKPTAAGASSDTLRITYNTATPLDIALSGTGIAAPFASLSMPSFNFGIVNVYSSSSQIPVIITNTGNAPLTFNSVTGAVAPFTVDYSAVPASIAVGASATFYIAFSPVSAGSFGPATLTVDTGTNDPTINLSGTGAAPACTLSPTSQTFAPAIAVGSSSAPLTTTVTNTGTGSLKVYSITLDGAGNPGDFALTPASALPWEITSGSKTFDATFTPTADGTRTATVRISTNDPVTPVKTLTLTATGQGPALSASPASAGFGEVTVNTISSAVPISITNGGAGNATLVTAAIVGDGTGTSDPTKFSIAAAPAATLASAATTSVSITFSPTAAGTKTAILRITCSPAATLDIPISGTGVAPVCTLSPLSQTFATAIRVGSSSAALPTTVTNTGTGTLKVYSITLDGAGNPGDFALTPASALPWDITSGSKTFDATFTPTANGNRTATVKITSNDPANPVQTITLSGTGKGLVDAGDGTGQHSSIAVNGTNIYIAYHDDTNGTLKFAKSADSGAAWTLSTIDYVGSYAANERNVSMVMTGTTFYIAYYDQSSTNLKYAKSTDSGSTWTKGFAESSTFDVGTYCSIALTSANNVYISYYDATNKYLRFAYSLDGASTWSSETVSTATTGQYTSISACVDRGFGNDGTTATVGVDADSFDDIYICFSSVAGSLYTAELSYDKDMATAGHNDGDWIISSVTAATGQYGSLAVKFDTSDQDSDILYICYYSSADLCFQKSADGGTAWLATPVSIASTDDVGKYCSLVRTLDRAADGDDLYTVFYDASNGSLMFSSSTDGGMNWISSVTVDTVNNTGQYPAIAVAPAASPSADKLYVSYHDASATHLRFVSSSDGGVTW